MTRALRSVRVPTPGLRARVENLDADLLNVSATGALVRTECAMPVGSVAPVILDVDNRRIALGGRVVRCLPTTIQLPSGATLRRKVYAVGLTFLERNAMQAVAPLCRGRVALEELRYGILFAGGQTASGTILCASLVDAGYEVHVVHETRRALARAKETGPDLVIVELEEQHDRTWWKILEALAADSSFGEVLALFEPAALTPIRQRHLAERNVSFLLLPLATEELLDAVERALRGPS